MYGMINKAIRTLVIREASEEIWEDVLEASGIDEDVYGDLESQNTWHDTNNQKTVL